MPTELTLAQFGLIVGIIAGFVLGLIPLILGFKKKNIKYGVIGFILTLIGGAFLSLLGALPVAGVFIWLILQKPKADEAAAAENSSDEIALSDD